MESTITESRETITAGTSMDETEGLTYPRIECKNINVSYGDK